MQFLKADTSAVIMLGPAVDITDGVTLESGLVTAMDTATTGVRISKNGAAWADRNGTVTTTVYDEGWYRVTLNTTDTNTEGTLDVMFEQAATCLPMMARFQIVNANVYDSLFAAATTDYLQVDAIQLAGTTQDATDLADFAAAGYDPATNKVQGVVLTDTLTTYTGNTVQTGDAFARLGAPAGASIAADLVVIDNFVDGLETTIGAAGAGLTALATAAALATVDTNVDNLNLGIIYGATTGTPTTTSTNTDLTGYANSELVGRVIVFTSGTADGQAATITTYAATSGVVGFAALTTAPAASDTFKIV